MDLKTIELEILKINEEFITYLDKVSQESEDKIDSLLRNLNLRVDEKSTFIKSLEEKIITLDEDFKRRVNDYTIQIDSLVNKKKDLKYNLINAAQELEKQKTEELKPFLLQQKKKKTEITHKITAQRKELSFLHKENNSKFIEEEKNFKNREIELTRRMDIDLTRLTEANVKQYSDIEKSILEMEDEKLIREAQKKINSIRRVGIKEILEIKNKYAVLNYENSLEFKKFQEKNQLDNLVLTEEFKQRIKNMEFEKELLEDEEKLKLTLIDFDNELKMREFERENDLDLCEFEKARAEELFQVNQELLGVKTEENKNKTEAFNEVNDELLNFDKTQITEFVMGDSYQFSVNQKVIESLVSTLRNYIASYRDLLIVVFEDYNERRKSIVNELISILSVSKFDLIHGIDSSYTEVVEMLKPVVDEYLKMANQNFNKFSSIIKTLVKNLESQMNLTMLTLNEYWKDFEHQNNRFLNTFKQVLETGFDNKRNHINNFFKHNSQTISNTSSKNNEDLKQKLVEYKEETKSIINDYNIKKRDILARVEEYKLELKLKQEKDKKELNKFIKQSKLKINNYKKIYATNIANHERVEYNAYKEVLKQNKIEYRNRLESIDYKK